MLSAVTNAVTAPALVVVGILMAQQLKEIEWDNMVYATAGFITVLMMILTYSISNGIAFGFIAYAIAMTAAGKTKEVHITVWVLMVIFLIYFAHVTHPTEIQGILLFLVLYFTVKEFVLGSIPFVFPPRPSTTLRS